MQKNQASKTAADDSLNFLLLFSETMINVNKQHLFDPPPPPPPPPHKV